MPSMPTLPPLLLMMTLMVAVLGPCSALQCYMCKSQAGGSCDRPLDTATAATCSNGTICFTFFGQMDQKPDVKIAKRGCFLRPTLELGCHSLHNHQVPGTEYSTTGDQCSCNTDLCNSGPRLMPPVAQLAIGVAGLAGIIGGLRRP